MDIPKSWNKTKKQEAEFDAFRHISKPDLDNILKAAMDGISGSHGIVLDDKQIHSIKARKVFCHPDRGPVLYISVANLLLSHRPWWCPSHNGIANLSAVLDRLNLSWMTWCAWVGEDCGKLKALHMQQSILCSLAKNFGSFFALGVLGLDHINATPKN